MRREGVGGRGVGDTSPAFQAKLLRVLQEREFLPVGAERIHRTEARVIAATHRDLEALLKAGRFREDLYFRLRVIEIRVPPLWERRADIPLLARYLATKIGREMHRDQVMLSEPVLEVLQRYDWPGNVRELEHALQRALVLARGPVVGVEHLALTDMVAAVEVTGVGQVPSAVADASLAAVERAHLVRILQQTGGNKREACRVLRISRARLDRLVMRHAIVAAEYEAPVSS